jgi:hypothetical protein
MHHNNLFLTHSISLNMKNYIPHGTLPLLFALLLIVLLTACGKDDPPPNTYPPPIDYTVLPPATQTGAGTFGCKVDGAVWVPRVPLLAVTYRDIEATVWEKDGSGAGIITTNLVDIDKNIDNWFVITFSKTSFEHKTLCDTSVFASFRTESGVYYSSDLINVASNCIEITKIDSIKNFVSGTFNFTLYRDSTKLHDKIKITEGRFDLPYYPQ